MVDRGSSRAPLAAELPPEFATVDVAVTAALGGAGAAESWTAGQRSAVLAWLARHRGALAVLESRVVAAERSQGTWALTGDRNLADFVGRVTRGGRGVGFAAVGQASTLEAMPTVAEAVVGGPVTAQHVREITRAVAASPKLGAELASSDGQARLVELAGRMDGREFGRALRLLSASVDPATRQRDHDQQRADRFLNVSHGPGGTDVRARLDSVSGRKLAKALGALDPRPTKDDVRSGQQRRADALMAMVERVAGDRATTPGAVAPVQALLTIREETWAALRGTPGARPARPHGEGGADSGSAPVGEPGRGSAADVLGVLRGVASVADEDGNVWPASEVARALCDCELTRAVVGAAGQVLDLGRGSRLFKREHWLALHAAGVTTCAVEGCSMPLRYTELHHIRWWDRDRGPTSLVNCAPLCAFHHHEVHRRDLRITRGVDGSYRVRWPDGRMYGGAMPGESGSPGADPARPPGAPARPDGEDAGVGDQLTLPFG